MKKNLKLNEKRKHLKELSKPIRAMVKEGVFSTVNQGLKEIYAQEGHTELKTIKQWNRDGMRVKKGERSLLLWGSPRKIEVVEKETEEVDVLDYYPICFVFSSSQVTESEKGGKQ